MRKVETHVKVCRHLLNAILASMAFAGTTHGDLITRLDLADGTSGSPIVTVYYTNADGTGRNSASVYADPQVSGGTTAPIYYCIDLWHDNNLGATYTITPTSAISYATRTFADVDNRLAWLMNRPQDTVDERAAVQLAMWYTIDNSVTPELSGFSFTGGDAALRADYNALISFAGYDPNVHYAARFWDATHDLADRLYQNLISAAPPGLGPLGLVPEPDSRILLGIGAAAMWLYARWRRRENRRTS